MKEKRPLPTKDRLIRSAAELFRRSGYNGVGLNELLSAADAPKGSLYHHFPNGKPDLALAAATWASDRMLRLIAAAYEPAGSFSEGTEVLCDRLAEFFDRSGQWDGCPISGTLFEGPDNQAFRDHAAHLYEGWISEAAHHAKRLGVEAPDAVAEEFFMLIQGAWQLSRTRRSSAPLRSVPAIVRRSFDAQRANPLTGATTKS